MSTDTDLKSIPLDRLEDEIVSLAAEVYALTCRWLCLVAEFERRGAYAEWGFQACSQWLAWRCGLSERSARDHVRVARRLPELPRIREAFGRGELSYSKVRALARVATAEDEGELLELAEHANTAQLERIVRAYRGALDLGAAERAHRERFFEWSWEADGSLSFSGRLPGEDGSLFMRALEAARDGLREEAWAAAKDSAGAAKAEEPASEAPEITNADAVVSMGETLLTTGPAARTGGDRYQVVVHVDAAVITGERESGRCATSDGSPLAAETARRLACDASLVPIVERDGKVLSVGRKSRSIPPALRRALNARDGGCRFPGCNNRRFVDNHHLRPWAKGGETSEENLVQLCRPHHHLIHEGGFSVQRCRDRFVFRRPDGRVISQVPCVRRRRIAKSSRRSREVVHHASAIRNDRLELDHSIHALLSATGPAQRCRGPD